MTINGTTKTFTGGRSPLWDVAIIGGGPAGSTAAAYLARAGLKVTLFERAVHPRPHVGESLVPSTTRVFKEIGFLETMEAEGFPRKYGAAWHPSADKRGEFCIEFKEIPQQGVDQDYTYHVDRGRFDLLLLKHAQSLGAAVHQGVSVQEVLFDGSRASGVRVEVAGNSVCVDARVVVDASGRNTLLANQLRTKQPDPIFNQYAVHSWFENVGAVNRETAQYIHIFFLPQKRAWVWQIPITDRITSVGVVAERETFKQAKLGSEPYFLRHVHSHPELSETMRDARRVREYSTEADYSYRVSKLTGDGFLVIGDAGRFVDPIFSSGVSVAMTGAKLASEQIIQGMQRGDLSASSFEPYEARVRSGVEVWYEFIRLYYKVLPFFTHFLQSPNYRHEILKLLQGEVYDRSEVQVLRKIRSFVETVEAAESHAFKQYLTDMPID